MSGIVGSLNTRGSGLIADLGTDGQVLTSAGVGMRQIYEAAAAGGYIAEGDFFSFDMATATGSTTHTGLSLTPSVAYFSYNPNAATIGYAFGWMTPGAAAGGRWSGTQNLSTAGLHWYGNTYAQCVVPTGGYQQVWISAASAGQYTMSNIRNGTGTGTGYFSIILFGTED